MAASDDILEFLEQAFALVPLAIAAGKTTHAFAKIAANALRDGGKPTPEAWAALRVEERRLRDIINKPV